MRGKKDMHCLNIVQGLVWVALSGLLFCGAFAPSANAQPQAPDFTNNVLECEGSLGEHFGPDAMIFGVVERGETLTFTLHIVNTGNVDVPSADNPAVTFIIFNYAQHLENVQLVSIPGGASANATHTDSIVVENIGCSVGDTVRIVWTGDVYDPGPDPEGYRNWISTYMSPDYYATWPGWYARQEPAAYFRLDGLPASIGDFVFNDLDGDGIFDGGEPGIDGVDLDLYVDQDGNGSFDPAVDTHVGSATTAGGGIYHFTGLDPETYFVDVVEASLLPGMQLTYGTEPAGPVTIGYGENNEDVDFGYHQVDDAYDFGDVIDPAYSSYLANNGPRHLIGDMWLGGWINGESDSKQTDMDEWDDGVVFLGSSPTTGGPYKMPYAAGTYGAVQITVRGTPVQAAYVDGWIDWNIDGDWDDEWEHVVDVCVPIAHVNVYIVEFWVPDGAPAGDGWARFRLYEEDYDSYVGEAGNGEVEDYFLLDGQVPVELSSFEAIAYETRVKIRWTTESELENMGFYLTRSNAEDGLYEKINASLIPGAGTTEESHQYQFVDRDIIPGIVYYYKLVDVDYNGNVGVHGPIEVTVPKTPDRYDLEQNYPNPFNPQTTVGFRLGADDWVHLSVYNLRGQLVKRLVDNKMVVGRHEVVWDGTDESGSHVPTGTYLYVLKTGDQQMSRYMILVR